MSDQYAGHRTTDMARAVDALFAIPPDLPRDEWVRTGMAAHAAGVEFDIFNEWSGHAPNYSERDARDTWRSFKHGRGIGPGTLIHIAKEHGWQASDKPRQKPTQAAVPRNGAVPPRKPPPGMHPDEVWARFIEATAAQPYVATKQGIPDGLRVVPDGDPLRIVGESMVGSLVVPAYALDGSLQSLQLIASPDTAARLKAQDSPSKLNLPGSPMAGASFTVGPADGPAYLCEGIGQAWACYQATGQRAVVCFGWGNVRTVAAQLRERDAAVSLVLVPDVGKEAEAEKIAREVGAAVAYMPPGEAKNFDANDLMRRDGFDVLAALLEGAQVPEQSQPVGDELKRPAPKPLDLRALSKSKAPERRWIRQDWIPPGPMLVAGSGGSGKSSMTQHEATAGALGRPYFAPECTTYRSLIWNCEDDHDEIWRRQERICEHEQIDMSSLADNLHLVSRYGCENALMVQVHGTLLSTGLMEELRQQVNDLAIDVLWLDNAAHVFLGDHDNRTDVTQFINAMNGLVRGRPFTVAVVAHPGRAQGSEFSGSVAWENAVRMRWYLGSKLPDQRAADDEDEAGRTDVRFLAKRKSNYSARDYVRMTMLHGLLVPDEAAHTRVGGIVAHLDEKRAEEACVAGFRSLCVMGIRTTDGKTSPDYLPSQLVAKGLSAGFSKSEMGKAMNRLMTRGVFARAPVGQHANRSPKFGLVLKEEAI